MNFCAHILVSFFLVCLSLQPGMRTHEKYSVDLNLNRNLPVITTSDGFLVCSQSGARFPSELVSLSVTDNVIWSKSIAFLAVAMVEVDGGVMVLDEHGNFYALNNEGSVTDYLAGIVEPGRNVIAKSDTDLVYASGSDNSLTGFTVDGNIQLMVMCSDSPMHIYPFGEEVIVSGSSGSLTRYDVDGEVVWQIDAGGFTIVDPVLEMDSIFVYALRNITGSSGSLAFIDRDGTIKKQTELDFAPVRIDSFDTGYILSGRFNAAFLTLAGDIVWSKKLDETVKSITFLGVESADKLALAFLYDIQKGSILSIRTMDLAGTINEVCQFTIEDNQHPVVGLSGRALLVGLEKKITVYELMTMKEFIDGMNRR